MEESNEVDISLPPGFRFTPTVEELINLYLIPKNTNQPLPCNVIKEKPLYCDDPWRVLDINNPHNKWDVADTDDEGYVSKMKIYIFTKLTKKKQAMVDEKKKKQVTEDDDNDEDDAKKFVRTAGSGTWKSHTGKKGITNGEGEVIGFMRQLAFKTKRKVNPNNPSTSSSSSSPPGRYTMHEFSVARGESTFVLCEITLWLKRMTSTSVCNVKGEAEVVVEDVTREVGKRLRVDDGHDQLGVGGTGDAYHHVAASSSSLEQYDANIPVASDVGNAFHVVGTSSGGCVMNVEVPEAVGSDVDGGQVQSLTVDVHDDDDNNNNNNNNDNNNNNNHHHEYWVSMADELLGDVQVQPPLIGSLDYVGDIFAGYQGSEHEQLNNVMMVGNNSSGLICGKANHIIDNGVEKPVQVIDDQRFKQSLMALEASLFDEDDFGMMPTQLSSVNIIHQVQQRFDQEPLMTMPSTNTTTSMISDFDRKTLQLIEESGFDMDLLMCPTGIN